MWFESCGVNKDMSAVRQHTTSSSSSTSSHVLRGKRKYKLVILGDGGVGKSGK